MASVPVDTLVCVRLLDGVRLVPGGGRQATEVPARGFLGAPPKDEVVDREGLRK